MESRHCGQDKRIFFCPVQNASTPCSLQVFGIRCISIFLMIIISTSLTVPTQPSHRFHVDAWLPFRNREMDYLHVSRYV